VENISPQLSDKIRTELITQLIATFAWHQVIVTREIYEKIKPDNADIVALRGGDWARARAIWKQAVLDAPDNAAAWNNLGVAYEQALMPNEAQQAYARALALKPKDKMILRNSRGREGR
jgi:Flp pilus assembly protein TadD